MQSSGPGTWGGQRMTTRGGPEGRAREPQFGDHIIKGL